MNDAIIISDLHLGSDICRAKELEDFLFQIKSGKIETERLILNGDVFDNLDFRRLKKSHWKILSTLRKLSKKINIIWICGNHDGPADMISHLLGIDVVDDYVFQSGDNKILLFHGHVYDDFINAHPIITRIADILYSILMKIDRNYKICQHLKGASKTYARCQKGVESGAVKFARHVGANIVCCGHTHTAKKETFGNVEYYNSGSFCELPAHFLSISDGTVEIMSFPVDKAFVF